MFYKWLKNIKKLKNLLQLVLPSYNPELVNKLNDYSKLIEIDRTKLISSLTTKELEGKVLNNDFINLNELYYFNFDKLINEGTVKATLKYQLKPLIPNLID